MTEHEDLVQAFTAIARQLATNSEPYKVIANTARLATRVIESCDHAGVTLFIGGQLRTPPLADPVSATMDELQIETGEGPCVDAAHTANATETPDLLADERWPRLAAAAATRVPVRSVYAERLRVGDRTLGAINLYAEKPNAFDDNDREVAPIFVAYAGLAVFAAGNNRELTQALQTRDVIGQAKGILIARYGIDDEAAFEMLRQASMRLNRKLRLLAQDVVDRNIDTEDLR